MLVTYEQEKNRRQVPKVREYLAMKDYSDVLYCYLQVISQYDAKKEIRFVPAKECKFTAIANNLGMTRQTISKKFKVLEEAGLIRKFDDRYEIINLEKEIAELVPFTTLRILTNTVRENVISTFVYLLVRYRAEKEQEFKFTLEQIKRNIGVGVSRSTDYIVTDILLVLKKLDLLDYELRNETDDDGSVKSIYYVTNMSNKIVDFKDIEERF